MRKYKRLIFILALSLLMVWALIKLGNVDLSLATLGRVQWGWYSLVIVSYYASIMARGWRWQRILRTMGWPVGFIYTTTLLTAGLFLSAILPARAGDVGRVAMLRQDHQMPVTQGIASIAGERVLDIFAILTLALLGAWLALSGRMPPEVVRLVLGVGSLLVSGLIGLLVAPGIENWLREPPLLPNILPVKLWTIYQKVLDFVFSLIEGVRILGRQPGALAVIVGQSFFIWLWDALMVYFILISLRIVEPFSVSLFAAMISDLVTAIPLTPGALGQFDAALIGLLALFGISAANAGLTVLLLRLVQLWTFIPVSGLVTYIFGFSRVLHLGQAETLPDQIEISGSTAGQVS